MDLSGSLLKIKRGILLFWALWFALVLLTNLMDALKALSYLPETWSLASGNWGFMKQVTAIYGTPVGIVAVMFLGVMVWEGTAAFLFWRAFDAFPGEKGAGLTAVNQAFTVGLAFWATFMLADEFFIAYELEGTHRSYAIAQLVSFLGFYLLPDKEP